MQSIVTYATGMYYSCLKSVLRHKYLIFDSHHPESLYLRQDTRLFFEVNKNQRAKILGNILKCDKSGNYKY